MTSRIRLTPRGRQRSARATARDVRIEREALEQARANPRPVAQIDKQMDALGRAHDGGNIDDDTYDRVVNRLQTERDAANTAEDIRAGRAARDRAIVASQQRVEEIRTQVAALPQDDRKRQRLVTEQQTREREIADMQRRNEGQDVAARLASPKYTDRAGGNLYAPTGESPMARVDRDLGAARRHMAEIQRVKAELPRDRRNDTRSDKEQRAAVVRQERTTLERIYKLEKQQRAKVVAEQKKRNAARKAQGFAPIKLCR